MSRLNTDGAGRITADSTVTATTNNGPVVFQCPEMASRNAASVWLNSYGLNNNGGGTAAGWGRPKDNSNPPNPMGFRVIDRVLEISEGSLSNKIFADERAFAAIRFDRWGRDFTIPTQTMARDMSIPGAGRYGIAPDAALLTSGDDYTDYKEGRHGLTHNILFMDGHAKSNTAYDSTYWFHNKIGNVAASSRSTWTGSAHTTPGYSWNLIYGKNLKVN